MSKLFYGKFQIQKRNPETSFVHLSRLAFENKKFVCGLFLVSLI